MIVQITLTRNECFLIKELLPIWQKYADGFIFYNHFSDDDTAEFLEGNKEKYNILKIINPPLEEKDLPHETNIRQQLFDEALKHTNKIICLDTDEYLDGNLSKENLEKILDENPNTVFYSQWTQYVNKNTLRVDGEWSKSLNDRIGMYQNRFTYPTMQRHSLHLPPAQRTTAFNSNDLFIAHLQWLDKRWVGVKQYYWKVTDYVANKVHGVQTVGKEAYDNSVNNFQWDVASAPVELKIRDNIYKTQDIKDNFKLKEIVKLTKEHNIPNLGDWGMGIYEYAAGTFKQTFNSNFSICITTFREREEMVKELITNIRKFTQTHDIILLINGNNEEKMDETYRENMLSFCASINNCYPIVCPEFKSLSKLWNTGVIFSNTEYNLVLNDDTKLENAEAFKIITDYINSAKHELFTINGMFSHFVVTKTLLHNLNYFDERLLAFGEEDGDLVHRYILKFGKKVPSLFIEKFNNTHAYNFSSKKLETHIDNKPKFNREFAKIMYKEDPNGICGMNPTPIKKVVEDIKQYPYELFVNKNKHNIKTFTKIDNSYD